MSKHITRKGTAADTGNAGHFATTERKVSSVTLGEPEPRKGPKRKHFTVTGPDGTVLGTRSSDTRIYTHAVVVSAQTRENLEQRARERVERLDEHLADIEDAIPKAKFYRRDRGFRSGDVSPTGEHSYHNYEAIMKDPESGTVVASTWCDSTGMTKYTSEIDEDGVYQLHRRPSRAADQLRVDAESRRREAAKSAAAAKDELRSIQGGEVEPMPAYVLRWSMTPDAAHRASRSREFSGLADRGLTVVEVDQ